MVTLIYEFWWHSWTRFFLSNLVVHSLQFKLNDKKSQNVLLPSDTTTTMWWNLKVKSKRRWWKMNLFVFGKNENDFEKETGKIFWFRSVHKRHHMCF